MILSVDYRYAFLSHFILNLPIRLAPEYPFPHAQEDSYTVLRWLEANPKDQPEELRKVNRQAIIVGGKLLWCGVLWCGVTFVAC